MAQTLPIFSFHRRPSAVDLDGLSTPTIPERWGHTAEVSPVRAVAILDPDYLHFNLVANLPFETVGHAVGEFREGLWHGDVFEVFLGACDGEAYEEWNFSPNGAWWYARFDRNRVRTTFYQKPAAPAMSTKSAKGSLMLKVALLRSALHFEIRDELSWRVNVCAIFGEAPRRYFSWADIPVEKPDFHRKEYFAVPSYIPRT